MHEEYAASKVGRRTLLGAGLAAVLTACGGNSGPGGAGAKGSGTVTTWYFPFGANVEAVYKKLKQDFEKANSGTTVKMELQPWDNRYPKMLAALAAGEGPDVMFMTPDALIQYAEANAIAPLDDLLPKEIWTGIPQATIDNISYEGKKWYLPINHESPCWLYNKTLLEQIGRDPEQPPQTWDDMREICVAAKKAGNGLYGWGYAASSDTLNTTFYPFLYQAGGRPLSEDGTEATFNSDAGVEALEFIVELFAQGWAPKYYLTPHENDLGSPFFQGKQVVSIQYKENNGIGNARQVKGLDWAVGPILKHKEQWGFGATQAWAISNRAEDKDAAAKWVTYLGQPDNVLTHCEAFLHLPSNEDVAKDAFKDDKLLASLQSQTPHIFDEQKNKNGRALMPLVIPELQAAILGKKKPKQALDAAADAVNALLARG